MRVSVDIGKWNIRFDPALVRGMSYYEVSHPNFNFSLAGGGRYDNMIDRFIDPQLPACGFFIGFE
jgi:histidyl-tRNA synthetase